MADIKTKKTGAKAKKIAKPLGTKGAAALVTRFAKVLEERQPKLFGRLKKGATPKKIEAFQAAIGVSLPESFYAFYRLANGERTKDGVGLFGGLELLSLDAIVRTKKVMDQITAEGSFDRWAPGEWWNEGWVPLCDNHSYDMICIDTAGSFDGVPGQILHWSKDSATRTIYHPSFDAFLEMLIARAEDEELGDEDGIDFEDAAVSPGYPKHPEARAAKDVGIGVKPPKPPKHQFGERPEGFTVEAQYWAPEQRAVGWLAASPDGALLAVAQSVGSAELPTLSLIRAADGEIVKVLTRERLQFRAQFLGGGDRLAALTQTDSGFEAVVHDLARGTSMVVAEASFSRMNPCLDFDRHGRRFVFTGERVEVRDLGGGKARRLAAPTGAERDDVMACIAPDGAMAAVAGSGKIALHDATSGVRVKVLEGPFGALQQLAFSPDGKWIVAVGEHCRGVHVFDVASGARVLPDVFGEETSGEWSAVVTPDRQRIATGGLRGALSVYEARTGLLLWMGSSFGGRLYGLCTSPDGKRLYSGAEDGQIAVVRMA